MKIESESLVIITDTKEGDCREEDQSDFFPTIIKIEPVREGLGSRRGEEI